MRSPFPALVLVLGCALALGCDDELDAEPAPLCTDEAGCPIGSRCVDGRMCVLPSGAQPRMDPPRFELSRPGGSVSPRPPRQRDAGAGLDGGQLDGGLRDAGRRSDAEAQCLPGQALCTSGCANLAIDANNCGGCGIGCPDGELCTLGVCCGPARTVCADRCVDTFTDRGNCGVCELVCDIGSSCVAGICTPDADPTF